MKPKINFNTSQIRWAAVVALVVFSLLAGAVAGHLWAPQPAMAVRIERIWADVNHDGLTDLIVEGSVIFQSPLQPTPAGETP